MNKIDSILEEQLAEYKEKFSKYSKDIFAISAVTKEGLDELLYFVAQKVDEIPKPVSDIDIEEDLAAYDNDDSDFEVIKVAKDAYVISG